MRPLSKNTELILILFKEGKDKNQIYDIMNSDESTKITKQGISNAISRYSSNGTPNGNGKPKEDEGKMEDIIFPPLKTENYSMHKINDDNPYLFSKEEIEKMLLHAQSHITRYSEKKRKKSPQNELLWNQAVTFKENLLKRLDKIGRLIR